MGTYTKIAILLVVLAIMYGYWGKGRESQNGQSGQSQDALLEGMSHDELVDLLIKYIPGRPNIPAIQAMSDDELKSDIRDYMKPQNEQS